MRLVTTYNLSQEISDNLILHQLVIVYATILRAHNDFLHTIAYINKYSQLYINKYSYAGSLIPFNAFRIFHLCDTDRHNKNVKRRLLINGTFLLFL